MVQKKSISISDIENSGLKYYIIHQERLRTRYRYDMDRFLSELEE